jgi:adenylyltransferase/sulfurtransferase
MEGRYARQEALDFIGTGGQRKLSKGVIAIVGCGALGSVAAELLARAGIGKLILIDRDVVDITNLQRQALYTEHDISKPKASCLRSHIAEINSGVAVVAHDTNLDFGNIGKLVSGVDLLLDCTDNIDARLLVNEFCVKKKLPWIHSAAIQAKGVVLAFVPGGPCFRCVFPLISPEGSCEELGVLNSATHMTASVLVVEALKVILGKKAEQCMLRIDALCQVIDRLRVKKDPDCPVCRGDYSVLKGVSSELCVKECTTRKGWSVKLKQNVKLNLANIKKRFRTILDADILVVIDYEGEIIVHGYGELLFKDLKDERRIREIADEIYKAGGVK